MDFLALLAIAFALAIDAFAVAVAAGLALSEIGWRRTFRLGWHFGLFQALMTLIGWGAGVTARQLIESVDHWIAFGLLLLVGGRMVIDAIRGGEQSGFRSDPTKGGLMVLLSIATSIDAMAVGLAFSMLPIGIIFPSLLIGLIALLMTVFGIQLGERLGRWAIVQRWAQLVGGLVLLAIGVKVLIEHGMIPKIW